MNRIFRIISFIVRLFIARIIAKILLISKKNRNMWIIAERGDDARDNGYFFFKFVKENHPDQRIIYVIKSSSSDFSRVNSIGETVEYCSFKHFIYFSMAKVRISSSAWGGDMPYADYFNKMRFLYPKKTKFVFLKHGIVKDYLPMHTADVICPDLYICGAKPEYEYVKENFGYSSDVVKYTGLARFDNLHDIKTKNQILIMPTFRRWLQDRPLEENEKEEYFIKYNEILNSDILKDILNKNNLKLLFYPHYAMREYYELFKTNSSDIEIAKFDDYDVQTLLMESKLLITDFSSVFFDFGYMNKPIVYYQFDRNKYIKEHYDFTKGYFSYEKDGFGKVVDNIESLLKEIENIINNEYKLINLYSERVNRFFEIKDTKNCERIYREICK